MQVTLSSLSRCQKQYQKVTLNTKIETLDKNHPLENLLIKDV
jgi:hypothetical protein